MFSNSVRLLLIVISALAAIYHFFQGNLYIGFLFSAGILFLAYGYFRYGSVWSAFQHLTRGNNEKAEQLINSVKYPNLLSKQQKAYYFFAKGILHQNKNNLDEAEKFYLQSLESGLRISNNESIVNLNLANIYHQKGLLDDSNARLHEASVLPHKEQVEKEIQELKIKLES